MNYANFTYWNIINHLKIIRDLSDSQQTKQFVAENTQSLKKIIREFVAEKIYNSKKQFVAETHNH